MIGYFGPFETAYEQSGQLEANEAASAISRYINGGSVRYLARALANDHPTLLGQVAKAVGWAILMRSTGNLNYPVGDAAMTCREGGDHPAHDGRLTCDTIRGAMLLLNQPLI